MSSKVGRSQRTPAKHRLLNATLGQIAGTALTSRINAAGVTFIDLCAGDGVPTEGADFWHGTSPGLMIRHARFVADRRLPACVDLYEINRVTFDQLLASLREHLGEPLASYGDSAEFSYGGVIVRARRASGRDATTDRIGVNYCVFINNDPNSIHDWAMRPTFVEEVRLRTWMCTTFSTMGCNVGGLKMLSPDERQMWFGHLSSIKNSTPARIDLMLCAIDRDPAQWAYAITTPVGWRDRTAHDATRAFDSIGRGLRLEWWRISPEAFIDLEKTLYLTKAENKQETP